MPDTVFRAEATSAGGFIFTAFEDAIEQTWLDKSDAWPNLFHDVMRLQAQILIDHFEFESITEALHAAVVGLLDEPNAHQDLLRLDADDFLVRTHSKICSHDIGEAEPDPDATTFFSVTLKPEHELAGDDERGRGLNFEISAIFSDLHMYQQFSVDLAYFMIYCSNYVLLHRSDIQDHDFRGFKDVFFRALRSNLN